MAVAESLISASLTDSNLSAFDTRYATISRYHTPYNPIGNDIDRGDDEFGMSFDGIRTIPDSGLSDGNNVHCATSGRIDRGNSADIFDFAVQRSNQQYIASLDIAEPFRVLIRSLNVGALSTDTVSDVNGDSKSIGATSHTKKDRISTNNTYCSRLSKEQRASLLSRTSFVEGRLLAFGEAITPPCRTVHSDIVCVTDKMPNSPQISSSASCNGTPHENQKQHIFEEWLFFPIPIGQLPLDSVLELTVYGADTSHQTINQGIDGCSQRTSEVRLAPIGKCATYIFSSLGRLKSGPKRYEVRSIIDVGSGREGRQGVRNTSGLSSCTPREALAPWEHMINQYRCGRLEPVPWLDRVINEEGIVEKMGRDLRQDPLQRVKECYYCSDLFVDSRMEEQRSGEWCVSPRHPCVEHRIEEEIKMDKDGSVLKEKRIDVQCSRSQSQETSNIGSVSASVGKTNCTCRHNQLPHQQSRIKLRNIFPANQDPAGGALDLVDYLKLDDAKIKRELPDSTASEGDGEMEHCNSKLLERRQRFSEELSKTLISIEFPSHYPHRTPIYHSCLGETYHTSNTILSAKYRLNILFPPPSAGWIRVNYDGVAGGSVSDDHSHHRVDGDPNPSLSTSNNIEGVSNSLDGSLNGIGGGMLGFDYSNAAVLMTQTTSGATSSVFNAQNSVIAKDSSVASAYHFSSFFPKCFVPYHDPDIKGDNNVYETKVSIISKARSSALLDAVEEPGYHQRKKIDGILNRLPVTLEAMNVDDAMLLWQYRRFLTKNPRAFVPFMSSLSWTKPSDVQEAERLMPMWRPIAVEDALILLSRLFAVSLSLRKYAISILAKESKASLQQILLQLTQAARYDHPPATNLSRSSQFHSSDTRPSHLMEGEVQSFLLDRCLTSWALLSNLYWYVSVESELEHGWIINQVIQNRQEIARNAADAAAIAAQRSGKSTKKNLKPNTVNLLSKEEMAEEPTLAEIMSLELSGTVFTRMRKNIMEKLKVTNILYYRRILKQKMLRESLTTLYKQLNSKKDRTQRIKYAKELINEKCCGLDELFPGTTKSGRGGGKVHSDVSLHNCEAGSEAGDVSGLFSTLARAGGSILKMSPTSGHSCEAALEGSLSFSGRGKWSAPPPLQASDSTDYDTPTFQSLKVTDAQIQMKRLMEQEEPIVHLPTHPIKAVNGITPDGVYLFKSAKMPIMLPFLEIRDYIDESEGILFQSPTHANTPAYPHKDTTDDSAINHPAPKASASTSTLNSSPALRNKCTIDDAGASGGSHSLSQSMSDEVVPFKVIFKSGDDVRQDQLVVQFIELMGNLLKSNGLDLCLTPYRVLATSENDGYVEVVPDVDTFQNVQKDVQGYLFRAVEEEYQLEQQALDKSKQIGVGVSCQNESLHAGTPIVTSAYLLETARKKKAAVMERFIKSCAGYCVITFLLGIGDRHLENLLITKDGRLLHIDFGFIFGNDPKPFPPPMKINKEMVEAIGGVQSEGYAQFKTYCCSAYTILRKHSHLILNLLLLMIDASIHQISSVNGVMPPKFTHAVAKHSNGPFDLYPTVGAGSQQPTVPYVDPRVNLIKIQDKLRLDLNDAEATQYIQNVIADSVGSIFTNLWDVIHVAAQATRN